MSCAEVRRKKYADEAEMRLATARSTADRSALKNARGALDRATALLAPRWRWWPWWRSGDREDVWEAIHDAEVAIQTVRDLPSQLGEAVEHARRDLPAKVAAERIRQLEHESDPVLQATAALDIVKAAHAAADRRIADLHDRTRLLWALAGAGSVAAVGAVWAQAHVAAPFLPSPVLADGTPVDASPAVLLTLVAGCGAIGGLLRAIADLTARGPADEVRWFDPKPAQAALKVVAGAWFGVIGVLAVATGLLIAAYTSMGAVLLIAIAFGYGQKTATGRLDRDVGRILDVEAGTARGASPQGPPGGDQRVADSRRAS